MTSLRTNIQLALNAIHTHRLRSFLTMLGLTMGVATLMAVMTIIQGANTFVGEKVAALGADVFRVRKTPFATTDFQEMFRARRNPDILLDDVRAVRESCARCEFVGASIETPIAVRYGNQELRNVTLYGQTANMGEISTRDIERGRYFGESEDRHAAQVCLIGARLAEQFFPAIDPIGRMIRVGKDPLRVIGTFEPIGSILGQDQDSYVIVPVETFRRMRGSRHSVTLEIKVAEEGLRFEQAQDQVRLIMRARRGIRGGGKEDFYIGTAASYIELWQTISSSFVLVFVSISSISAIVGGIVIMNVMLVSVTERTKEIGVRRACGARRGDIVRQFLAESILLCLGGGAVGVMLGFAVALLLRVAADFPADVRWWVAALGVAFASSVGLFFGIYPAIKAADLDPVEALRAE